MQEETTMQEFRRYFSGLRTRLKPGTLITTVCKYGFGTLLVFMAIVEIPAFRTIPQAVPAAVPSSTTAVSAMSRHSTLSADVLQEFVGRNGQRMYPRLSREIVDSAIKYSEKYDLSPILVLAIVATESEFYPFALSKHNAKGLMQINPDANQRLLLQEGIFNEPADIFDPERNIEAGCFLLRRFINESPDFNTALDKYLGANSASYKAQIHEAMGKILLLGITKELNRTSQKIETIAKVEPHTTNR
jgi:soluble lytic murein transglycosylase